MNKEPVIVGVNDAAESSVAATVGWRIARAAHAECHLVHGIAGSSILPVSVPAALADVDRLTADAVKSRRQTLRRALGGNVPAPLLANGHLLVRRGKPAVVLADAAQRLDAGIVVVGGKHHSPIGRWLGGSTAHQALTMLDVPLLVAVAPRPVRRILVGVDLSWAALPTLVAAGEVAQTLGAELRIVHAIEPIPLLSDSLVMYGEHGYRGFCTREFARVVKESTGDMEVTHVVRDGPPAAVLAEECRHWDADVLVVGVHGTGWVHRHLIGGTPFRLLNNLPTSLLAVPTGKPEGRTASSAGYHPDHAEVRPLSAVTR